VHDIVVMVIYWRSSFDHLVNVLDISLPHITFKFSSNEIMEGESVEMVSICIMACTIVILGSIKLNLGRNWSIGRRRESSVSFTG
jgi:hypothetical protein